MFGPKNKHLTLENLKQIINILPDHDKEPEIIHNTIVNDGNYDYNYNFYNCDFTIEIKINGEKFIAIEILVTNKDVLYVNGDVEFDDWKYKYTRCEFYCYNYLKNNIHKFNDENIKIYSRPCIKWNFGVMYEYLENPKLYISIILQPVNRYIFYSYICNVYEYKYTYKKSNNYLPTCINSFELFYKIKELPNCKFIICNDTEYEIIEYKYFNKNFNKKSDRDGHYIETYYTPITDFTPKIDNYSTSFYFNHDWNIKLVVKEDNEYTDEDNWYMNNSLICAYFILKPIKYDDDPLKTMLDPYLCDDLIYIVKCFLVD